MNRFEVNDFLPSRHHCLVPKQFHLPKRKSVPTTQWVLPAPPDAWPPATVCLPSLQIYLFWILRDHEITLLLNPSCLAPFTSRNVF